MKPFLITKWLKGLFSEISFNEKTGSKTLLIFNKSFIVLDFWAMVEPLAPKYSLISDEEVLRRELLLNMKLMLQMVYTEAAAHISNLPDWRGQERLRPSFWTNLVHNSAHSSSKYSLQNATASSITFVSLSFSCCLSILHSCSLLLLSVRLWLNLRLKPTISHFWVNYGHSRVIIATICGHIFLPGHILAINWSLGYYYWPYSYHVLPFTFIIQSFFISSKMCLSRRRFCSNDLCDGNTSFRYLNRASSLAPSSPAFWMNCKAIYFILSDSSPLRLCTFLNIWQ